MIVLTMDERLMVLLQVLLAPLAGWADQLPGIDALFALVRAFWAAHVWVHGIG